MTLPPPDDLLSPAECALAQRAREAFAGEDHEAEPLPGDCAAEDAAARGAIDRLARAGLLDETVPPVYRAAKGGNLSVRALCVLREEVAARSGLADAMLVMQGLGSCAIALAGDEALRARWLPAVARGEAIAAIAITEPEAGSDPGAIATRAVRDGDAWVLDGEKTWISNAGLADIYTVFARTSGSGREGLTAFAVPAGTPGLECAGRIAVIAPHPIGTIRFTGCRVPGTQRLGAEGEGFALAMRVLERFRPTVGAAANGFARRALEEARARALSRRQFGRAIAQFQGIRFMMADMATRLEAARLLVLRAASWIDAAPPGAPPDPARGRAASMAKLYATEAAQRTVDEAVQIHGAIGVMRGAIVERLYRECRALRIYEGTSEIQRGIIARSLLAEAR